MPPRMTSIAPILIIGSFQNNDGPDTLSEILDVSKDPAIEDAFSVR